MLSRFVFRLLATGTIALTSALLVACTGSDATNGGSPDASTPDGAAASDSGADTSASDGSADGGVSDARSDTSVGDAAIDAQPTAWVNGFGGPGLDRATSVAFDASGNVYVSGQFTGSFMIGTTLVDAMDAGAPAQFVVKIDPMGNVLWVKQFGPSALAPDLRLDPSGNVVIGFTFSGTVAVGGQNLVSAGDDDIAFVKIDPSGNVLLAKRFGGAGREVLMSIAVSAGAIVLGGSYGATVDFGLGSHANNGNGDAFLLALDANGTPIFDKAYGGPLDDQMMDLAIDANGNVTGAGQMSGSIDFGGGALVSAGGYDGYAASYSSTGTFRWAHRWGGPSTDLAYGLAIDGANNVYVLGYFRGSADFGGGLLTSAAPGSAVALSLDATGAYRWSKALVGTDTSYPGFYKPIAVDSVGNVVITGGFKGSIDFGGGTLASVGGADVFLAKLSSTGQHVWSHAYGGASDDNGNGVALAPSGSAALAGEFAATATFGAKMLVSAGMSDCFVLTTQ